MTDDLEVTSGDDEFDTLLARYRELRAMELRLLEASSPEAWTFAAMVDAAARDIAEFVSDAATVAEAAAGMHPLA